jgi:hypothetical protein
MTELFKIPHDQHALRAGDFMIFLEKLRLKDLEELYIAGDIFLFSELKNLYSDFIQPEGELPIYRINDTKASNLLLCLASGHRFGGDVTMIDNFSRYLTRQVGGRIQPRENLLKGGRMVGGMWLSKRDERN